MESQITFSRTNPKLINDSLKEIHFKKNELCYTKINQVATKRNNLLLK